MTTFRDGRLNGSEQELKELKKALGEIQCAVYGIDNKLKKAEELDKRFNKAEESNQEKFNDLKSKNEKMQREVNNLKSSQNMSWFLLIVLIVTVFGLIMLNW